MDLVNLLELEARAKHVLSPSVFHYYRSGAEDEVTLRGNRTGWRDVTLWPRMLRGAGSPELATAVLGTHLSMPVIVAPMAMQQMAHTDGEVGTARAVAEAGIAMALSTFANHPVEAVRGAGASTWFQLYVYRDRDLTMALVQRAIAAGAEALVFTVDAPMIGRREADEVHRFGMPEGLQYGHFEGTSLAGLPADTQGSALAAYIAQEIDANIVWDDIDWLAGQVDVPVLVKGVLRADDARRAVDHGAAGIVVSNHGGRQLDTAPSTAMALPHVVRAVGGRVPVLVDGSVRRGTDVVKALALGADAVMLGRPVLWGLALAGQAGVSAVLEHLRGELSLAMTLCGCRSIAEIDAGLLDPE